MTHTGIHEGVTWADGFGRWHAAVPMFEQAPIGGMRVRNERTMAQQARVLIGAELEVRGESTRRLRVERTHITGHGTVHYREVDN